jgi:hypothetical protein
MLYGARKHDVNVYTLSFMKYCVFINIYNHDECAGCSLYGRFNAPVVGVCRAILDEPDAGN